MSITITDSNMIVALGEAAAILYCALLVVVLYGKYIIKLLLYRTEQKNENKKGKPEDKNSIESDHHQ